MVTNSLSSIYSILQRLFTIFNIITYLVPDNKPYRYSHPFHLPVFSLCCVDCCFLQTLIKTGVSLNREGSNSHENQMDWIDLVNGDFVVELD